MYLDVVLKSYKSEVPNKGYWDYAFIMDVLNNRLWNPVNGFEFKFHDDFVKSEGVILIIPARTHADKIKEINEDMTQYKWVLIMLMGDEDGTFPTDRLKHPNMKIYLMLPHYGFQKNVDRFLINGYPTDTREILKKIGDVKRDLSFFFSGQITHRRRIELVEGLLTAINGEYLTTDGFTKGIKREEYLNKLAHAKVAPCPSGAIIPDSFRFYEALEAGCLPLADGEAPNLNIEKFWQFLFGEDELPFPIIYYWSDVAGTIAYFYDVYPQGNNKVFAWWQKKKREIVYNLIDDLNYLKRT